MGADNDSLSLDGSLSTSEVRKQFEAYQKGCDVESGRSYSGRLNMCPGIEFADKEFNSHDEAYEYLVNRAEKWGNAIAVKYKKSNPIDRNDSQLVKLQVLKRGLESELQSLESEFWTKVDVKLKSVEFIKCSTCKSKLETRFRVKTLKCPVCNGSFLSATDLKRRDALRIKIANIQTKINDRFEALQNKANKKGQTMRWLILGICSS